jgi:3-phenylpropionate/cinnamic acid dioxygenase small subunit
MPVTAILRWSFRDYATVGPGGQLMGEGTLQDRLEAGDVIVRYASGIDDGDFDAYRALFAEDVELSGFGPETIRGVDAWMAFVDKALAPFSATQHLLGPPHVDLRGARAELRCDLQAQHFFREPAGRLMTLWGTYRSSLVRHGGGWKIQRHQLTVRGTRISDPYRA